jgi:hypothetical protein
MLQVNNFDSCFSCLPKEVFTSVVDLLDLPAMAKCCGVSKEWQALISENECWLTICPEALRSVGFNAKAYIDEHGAGSFDAIAIRVREFAAKIGKNQCGQLYGVFPFNDDCKLSITLAFASPKLDYPRKDLKDKITEYLFIRLPVDMQYSRFPKCKISREVVYNDHFWDREEPSVSKIMLPTLTSKYISYAFEICKKNAIPQPSYAKTPPNSPESEILERDIAIILKERLTAIESLEPPENLCIIS